MQQDPRRSTAWHFIDGLQEAGIEYLFSNMGTDHVALIEAMAQLAGCAVLNPGDTHRKVTYLVGVDKVRFRRPVVPGDCFMMTTTVTKTRKNIGWVQAEARVDGELAVSGELMFSVSIDPRAFRLDATILHL